MGRLNAPGTRGRNALIALLAVAVLGLAVAWFLHAYERVVEDTALPPRGEAGYNPLYALGRTLQADGIEVQSRQRLDVSAQPLAPGDTLLVLGDPRSISAPQIDRLLEWVESGGHLLLRAPPTEAWNENYDVPVLDALGVLLTEDDPECEPLQVEGEDGHVEFCRGRRFFFKDVEPELAWGDLSKGYVHARLGYGQGHVDVLADFDFLTNSGGRNDTFAAPAQVAPAPGGLRDAPHQALARQVLAPNYGQGTMHLVYAARMPSLLRSVLLQGWPVWMPLLLALLAWLWLRMQRFGPQLPPPAGERRSLLEHVRASGQHLSRYNKRPLLYQAVKHSFLARLRRRDPLTAALVGTAQATALAQRFDLPIDTIQRALQSPASHDTAAFRDRVATLIQLRNRL